MSEFLLGVLTELSKFAKDQGDILVDGEHAKLTKEEVRSYYMDPKIRGKIIPQLTGRPAMLVQHHGDPVVRRKDKKGAEIMIEEGAQGPDNPADYVNWVHQHTVEFHPVHGEEVDHLYVDIDPKGNVPWEKTKEITKMVATVLRGEPDVTGAKIVYSGGRGFYVKAPLQQPVKTDKARSRLQKILAQIPEHVPMATLGIPGPSQVRLDTSTLHSKGSLRAEYSINGKTGLVSVPVHDLAGFEKEHATVKRVLGSK